MCLPAHTPSEEFTNKKEVVSFPWFVSAQSFSTINIFVVNPLAFSLLSRSSISAMAALFLLSTVCTIYLSAASMADPDVGHIPVLEGFLALWRTEVIFEAPVSGCVHLICGCFRCAFIPFFPVIHQSDWCWCFYFGLLTKGLELHFSSEFSLFYWSNYLDFLSSFLLFVPVVSPLTLWDINPVNTVCSQEQTERSLTPVEVATGQSRWITPTMGLSLLRPVLSLVVLQELIHRF